MEHNAGRLLPTNLQNFLPTSAYGLFKICFSGLLRNYLRNAEPGISRRSLRPIFRCVQPFAVHGPGRANGRYLASVSGAPSPAYDQDESIYLKFYD